MSRSDQSVEDVFTEFVASISEDTSIVECAKMMANNRLGFLIVMKDEDMVGVISERDIAFKAVAENMPVAKTPISTIMTKNVLTVSKSAKLSLAWQAMSEKGIRHLVVQESDTNPEIVGVLSIRDFIEDL